MNGARGTAGALRDRAQWRVLEDAQRDADTMFAQYQLSQLLVSGDALGSMADAVLEELARNTGAVAGALWLVRPDATALGIVASRRGSPLAEDADRAVPPSDTPPEAFASAAAAADWAHGAGWYGVLLDESRDRGSSSFERQPIGFLALDAGTGRQLGADHARFLALVRHELALAFRAAQLREVLGRERQMLSAIFDGASDAIVAVDGASRVVRLNPAAAALLTTSDPMGQPCWNVLQCHGTGFVEVRPPAAAAALACGDRCPFAQVLDGAAPITGREREVPGRDGPVPVAVSYARMPGDDAGAVGVLRDLRSSRELDELKSSFVAAVSHELRTPLALISGYAQTLLHMELDADRRRHYLEQLLSASDRLAALVDQILEIARLDSDRLRLDRRPISIASLIRSEVVDRHDADHRGGELDGWLRLDLPSGLPAVEADGVRIGQVVDNLVGNASKYAGGSPVTIRGRAQDGQVVISVLDDGPGIPPAERELVFERFFRGRAVAQSRTPGSGLGLFLCQRIVEAHGGRIWLDDVARGTSVSFSLPAAGAREGRHAGA